MPRKAKLLILPWTALGILVLAACLIADFQFPEPVRFLHCLILALLASTFKVRLPRMASSMSASFVLFLIGIAALPLGETLIMAVLATIVQSVWRSRARLKVLQVLFNTATVVISTVLGFAIVAPSRHTGGLMPALILAATLFFAINSGLVSLVLALINNRSVMMVWREAHRWAFPYYVAGAVIAGLVTAYAEVGGWKQAFATLPMIYVFYVFYADWVAGKSEQALPVVP